MSFSANLMRSICTSLVHYCDIWMDCYFPSSSSASAITLAQQQLPSNCAGLSVCYFIICLWIIRVQVVHTRLLIENCLYSTTHRRMATPARVIYEALLRSPQKNSSNLILVSRAVNVINVIIANTHPRFCKCTECHLIMLFCLLFECIVEILNSWFTDRERRTKSN